MFERGRIDHFALNVHDAETFEQLRTNLLARGSTDGTVTDFGVMRVLTFTDPDGHAVELAHWVGGRGPSEVDASTASDEERRAQRAAAAAEGPVGTISAQFDHLTDKQEPTYSRATGGRVDETVKPGPRSPAALQDSETGRDACSAAAVARGTLALVSAP